MASALVKPASVAPGGSLSLSVVTTGSPRRVQLYIGSGSPTGPAPVTYDLTPAGGGTWSATATAPSQPGQYQYSVGIFNAAGRRNVIGNDGWNLLVTGGSSAAPPTSGPSSGAQPLYADIPLAPPFSYGNPQPAVFTGAGQTITGSEVVSTRDPSTSATAVGQFYQVHLPRAGWTVDPSTLPAPGATSFSISATSGSGSGMRICIIQYSDFTVHIFYGTAG